VDYSYISLEDYTKTLFRTTYFTVFLKKINNSRTKHHIFGQLISSVVYQNKLKVENKLKLFFNSFLNKLLFQLSISKSAKVKKIVP
jgi:hypothetical protein